MKKQFEDPIFGLGTLSFLGCQFCTCKAMKGQLANILFHSLLIDVAVRRATPICFAYSVSWMARSRSSQGHPFSLWNIKANLQRTTHSRPNCGALQVTLYVSLVLRYCFSGSKISTYSWDIFSCYTVQVSGELELTAQFRIQSRGF